MSDETTGLDPSSQSTRLVELEQRLTFQQQTLDDLNKVVLEQQSELNHLRRELESLRILTQRLSERDEPTDLPDEKPPHY